MGNIIESIFSPSFSKPDLRSTLTNSPASNGLFSVKGTINFSNLIVLVLNFLSMTVDTSSHFLTLESITSNLNTNYNTGIIF